MENAHVTTWIPRYFQQALRRISVLLAGTQGRDLNDHFVYFPLGFTNRWRFPKTILVEFMPNHALSVGGEASLGV
nr:MAG: hypothetical protein BECKTUN1418D_GA0071000_11505 [Candidatus Kentron sp. TUN]